MPDADRRDVQGKGFLNHTADTEQSPLAGRSNHDGKLSQPEKKLQEAICVLLVELCERFTFFGIVCNMIHFCTVKLGYRNYQAAIVNMGFVGTSMLTPVLMGWIAECLVGRIKLMCICMFLHFLGTALLPVVSFPFEDVYIDRRHILHTLPKREQKIVFYFALLTATLGIGGIRAIVCPLNAYNLEDCGPKELLSFFNWFYWLVNLNSAVVFVSISYIQQSVARNLGFLIPFVSGIMAIITIHMMRGEMIYKPKAVRVRKKSLPNTSHFKRKEMAMTIFQTGSHEPGHSHVFALLNYLLVLSRVTLCIFWFQICLGSNPDSSLLTTFGVIGSALRTLCVRYRYFSGDVTNWLDHAKENCGGQYSEIQVESTKSLARLFPLFTFQILYRTCLMQIPSGYYLQTMNSNLHFSGFVFPIAAMNVISIVPLLILVPILECINSSCLFSSKDTGHSPTIYIELMSKRQHADNYARQMGVYHQIAVLIEKAEPFTSGRLLGESALQISDENTYKPLFSQCAAINSVPHGRQHIVGQLSAALSVMVAGFSEIHRKHFPQVEQTLSEEVLLVSSMPCFHLAPQYILLGVAEALVTPSCALLSFRLVPERIRGISMHFLALFNGAGCFMGAFLVQTAHAGTQGNWYPHLLHEGKLERFFFFLASLMMVNTLGFWTIAHRYNKLHQDYTNEFRGSPSGEKLLKHQKAIKHYNTVLESSSILPPMEES